MKTGSKLKNNNYITWILMAIICGLWFPPTVPAAEPADTNTLAAGIAPALAGKMVTEASASRRLQANDTLDVSVYQQPDLATRVNLDDRGMVMLPLLGPVKLGGLTLEQATLLVHDLYDKDYLVDPKVTLQVFQFAVLRYTILGQVQRPGSYEFPANEKLNLLDGIAMAGGYTRLAQASKVTLQRNVKGQLKVFNLDAESMAKDQHTKPFNILPGDTITVGERIF